MTAEYDVLRHDGKACAARLRAARVPVTLRRDDGLPHGFTRFHNFVAEMGVILDEVEDAMAAFCRRN